MPRLLVLLAAAPLLFACGEADDAPAPRPEGYQKIRGEPIKTFGYLVKRARRLVERGLHEAAVADLDRAIEMDGTFSEAYQLRGQARLGLVLDELRKRRLDAGGAEPLRPPILRTLSEPPDARTLAELEELAARDDARVRGRAWLELFERIGLEELRYDEKADVVSRGRFRGDRAGLRAWLRQGLERARRSFGDLLTSRPDDRAARNDRAVVLYRLGQHAAAASGFRAVVEAEAAAIPMVNLALTLEKLGRAGDATELYVRAMPLETGPLWPYFERGLFHESLPRALPRSPEQAISSPRLTAALADLDRAIDLDAAALQAYESRGLARILAGTPAAALTDLDVVLGHHPDRPRGLLLRGWAAAFAAAVDPDRAARLRKLAVSVFARLATVAPKYALVHHDRAWLQAPLVDDVLSELGDG